MKRKVKVIGVDMVKFVKPGRQEPYEVMASKAIRGAIKDAGIEFGQIESAFASYIYGDSTSGQNALYKVGMTGIPVFNVNNNCSSGSTALLMARQSVENGVVECALVFGFEEMKPGALSSVYTDRSSPMDAFTDRLEELTPGASPDSPRAARLFGSGGNEYIKKYGASKDIFAKVAVKTRSHAIHNPYSMFDKPLTLEEVQAAPMIFPPYLTRFCACPPSCGAAAAIVCSEEFARKHGHDGAVEIVGQAMATDNETTFTTDAMNLVGADMTRRAAAGAYEQAGFGPESVDVVELHDCFTPNEVITYEGLGLCAEGEAEKLIDDGDNTYGGRYVVNPSGGLMSKGHPIGATGLAQATELVWQLRGDAGKRQVEGARTAMQHNLGLGGAVVVTMYQKP